MRNPNRIDAFTNKLNELWHELPDFRFWQLIQALQFPKDLEGTDPFFWEDDVWLKIINNTIAEFSTKQ